MRRPILLGPPTLLWNLYPLAMLFALCVEKVSRGKSSSNMGASALKPLVKITMPQHGSNIYASFSKLSNSIRKGMEDRDQSSDKLDFSYTPLSSITCSLPCAISLTLQTKKLYERRLQTSNDRKKSEYRKNHPTFCLMQNWQKCQQWIWRPLHLQRWRAFRILQNMLLPNSEYLVKRNPSYWH